MCKDCKKIYRKKISLINHKKIHSRIVSMKKIELNLIKNKKSFKIDKKLSSSDLEYNEYETVELADEKPDVK